MSISNNIKSSIENSSWIRKMFEQGADLKARFGEENVFDFSLGNPDLEPPEKFFDILKQLTRDKTPGAHGYMPNAGYEYVRKKISKKIFNEQNIHIPPSNIIMSCGAAGGLNSVLKTILNPGENVIVPAPYFVEYNAYVSNHGGVLQTVQTGDDFSLEIDNFKAAINNRTRAIIINSPNNPTGKVYTEDEIKKLGDLLSGHNNDIYLISDEPYREIVYDGTKVPSIFKYCKNSIEVYSYSKSLSIPGERIGYVAVSPECSDADLLVSGIILSTRILGYVNAPALMQRIVAELTDVSVNIGAYQKRRDIFLDGLTAAGYSFVKPDGAFYIFCKSPIEDDVAFVNHLQKYNILGVPGSGFGGPGYFRLTYCVNEDIIGRSIPKFKEALNAL